MLNLNDLRNGLPAITPEWGSVLAQVAGVCLEIQGHEQGVILRITGLRRHHACSDLAALSMTKLFELGRTIRRQPSMVQLLSPYCWPRRKLDTR